MNRAISLLKLIRINKHFNKQPLTPLKVINIAYLIKTNVAPLLYLKVSYDAIEYFKR